MASLRSWATPLTIGAFALSAVTGVLMFFHADTGLNKAAHEWLGWALLAGVVFHVAANFTSLKNHLKSKLGLGIIALFLLLLGLSFVAPEGAKGGPPMREIMNSLSGSTIYTLAAVVKMDAATLQARLKEAGFAADDAQASPHDLSGGNRSMEKKILQIIFENGAKEKP